MGAHVDVRTQVCPAAAELQDPILLFRSRPCSLCSPLVAQEQDRRARRRARSSLPCSCFRKAGQEQDGRARAAARRKAAVAFLLFAVVDGKR